ncbi:MAG: integrase [Clostridiales bacterium]|jgi:Transposase and inactivated derivatives|nr:integrase [Clostridiales bacterium]
MARKINVKLILELRDARLSRNFIADSRHIARNSVSDVFRIANERNITYSDVRSLSETEVYSLFYPDKHAVENIYSLPDYELVHNELKKPGVKLSILFEEYQTKCKSEGTLPVGKTKFYDGYQDFVISKNLTNHIEHKSGEKVEVDWSGTNMSYVVRETGEIITVYLFVATLPYSQYSYVEACPNMKMDSFLRCHIHMYQYFGGVPIRTVCDNLKTGVVLHPKEGDIILTQDYEALGLHYMTAIMPTGVRKPKQKPSVEGTVGKIATAIIASLRNKTFYSLPELNIAISEKLYDFNHAPFQKREGSRAEIFEEEKRDLHPLPPLPYEIANWVYGRAINLDFHVVYNGNRYSCPYQYVDKKKVDLRITESTLEIYYKDERLTTHNLFPEYVKNRYSTHEEDMPPEFRKIKPWDDERIRNWAANIGPNTLKVINLIFSNVPIKEQGYNPSLSVLNLSKKYSDGRLETACELALTKGIRSPRYHHINAILASNQDKYFLEQKALPANDDSCMGYLRYASATTVKGDDGYAE